MEETWEVIVYSLSTSGRNTLTLKNGFRPFSTFTFEASPYDGGRTPVGAYLVAVRQVTDDAPEPVETPEPVEDTWQAKALREAVEKVYPEGVVVRPMTLEDLSSTPICGSCEDAVGLGVFSDVKHCYNCECCL